MNRLTKEQIIAINQLAPSAQGIFLQPYGIPTHIKELVIYCRYEIGGYSGGNCWDNSEPTYSSKTAPKDKMKVLDLVLKELNPNITLLQFREIEKLIHTNKETEYEYYGNSTNWEVEYIILSDLYKYLEQN